MANNEYTPHQPNDTRPCQPGTQMLLSPEEVALVTAHRKEKLERQERIVEVISNSISKNSGQSGVWEGWPGSVTIARTVYDKLVDLNIIKE